MILGLSAADCDEVARLLTLAPAEFWCSHRRWSDQEIADFLNSENNRRALGVWQAGQIGAVIFYYELRGIRDIAFVFTDPALRNRGLTTSLLQYLSENSEVDELWLEVNQNNSTAERVYRRFGFVEVGKRPAYYPDGGAALVMSWLKVSACKG